MNKTKQTNKQVTKTTSVLKQIVPSKNKKNDISIFVGQVILELLIETIFVRYKSVSR